MVTVEMSNEKGRPVAPGDVMFTVSKLSRMSRHEGDLVFDNDVGKIQSNLKREQPFLTWGSKTRRTLLSLAKTSMLVELHSPS